MILQFIIIDCDKQNFTQFNRVVFEGKKIILTIFKSKLDKNEQNGQNKALIQITLPNRNVNHADNAALEAAEEPEVNVIELAKEKGSVSRKEIEKLLGVSQSICGRLLKQMLMDGQIVQQGKGKNTRYVLQN